MQYHSLVYDITYHIIILNYKNSFLRYLSMNYATISYKYHKSTAVKSKAKCCIAVLHAMHFFSQLFTLSTFLIAHFTKIFLEILEALVDFGVPIVSY
jgi:hypothetical protein